MAGEGKCAICGREAARSLAASSVASVLGEARLASVKGKVGLCREHYKEYKRRCRAEREVELVRMKGIFR